MTNKIYKLISLINTRAPDCWCEYGGFVYLRMGRYAMIRISKDGTMQIADIVKRSSYDCDYDCDDDEAAFNERGILLPLNQKQQLNMSKLAAKVYAHYDAARTVAKEQELEQLLKRALEHPTEGNKRKADDDSGPASHGDCQNCGKPICSGAHAHGGGICASCISRAYNPR